MAEKNDVATNDADEGGAPTMDSRTIRLSKPIEGPKGPIREIVLKEPSAELVLKRGFPWKQIGHMAEDGGRVESFEMEFIPSRMADFISHMSGIDQITLGEMRARDMVACFNAVFGMLQGSAPGN